MSIDVQDSIAAGQHVARRAHRQAIKTVEAARDTDLHVPARAAKAAAKQAAKHAAKAAAEHTAKRGAKRALRVTFTVLVVGAIVGGVVAVVRRRSTSAPSPADVAPDAFGTAAERTEREFAAA